MSIHTKTEQEAREKLIASWAAYDYKRQVWVTGKEAIPLTLEQLHIEAETLRSPRAQEFAGRVPVALARERVAQLITECVELL